MTHNKRVLVLGASGGIGGEVARQLRDAGWQVQALKRNLDAAQVEKEGFTWHRGDAMNAEDVSRAADGCSVIVHAVNPPGYHNWSRVVLPMVDNTIAAARANGATIVLPGTVYNYSPDQPQPFREESPQLATTRKGRIRCEMERRLEAASHDRARVIIVRAGDFFGPTAASSWFSQGLIKPGKPVTVINNPGSPTAGHHWAYLPDVARTMVELLEKRETLPSFARYHLQGHWDFNNQQIALAIQRVVAGTTGTQAKIRPLPWWLLNLMSPFVTTLREMREMRYLWRQSVQMDASLLAATLGREPHTRLDEAVEATLSGLGCL